MPSRLRSLSFTRSLPCGTLHQPFFQVRTHFHRPALPYLPRHRCSERLWQIAEILRAVLGISNSGTEIQQPFGRTYCNAVWVYCDISQALHDDGHSVKPFRERVSQHNPSPPSLGGTSATGRAGHRGLWLAVTQRPATLVVRYALCWNLIRKRGSALPTQAI